MKTTTKLLSVFLSVLMVAMTCVSFGSLAFAEDAAVFASGECGDQGGNLTWTLSTDGVLTISGTGAMANYPDSAVAPWATNQLIDMDALTLQFLASKGYSFNSMQEAEAYIEAHPEVIDESIGFEMQLYYMETVNNLPTVRSLIIEEGVTSIARVFYLGLDSVSLPASLSAVPDGALLVDGTLTVHGIGTDVSNVCFRACQDGYAFATKAQRDDYETVQNQYYAAAVNLSHYMTPFTDEQVQAYMEAHEGMTEADARAEMQRNAENNARMLGVAFGVPGSSAADILHKAFLGIDGILGTSYELERRYGFRLVSEFVRTHAYDKVLRQRGSAERQRAGRQPEAQRYRRRPFLPAVGRDRSPLRFSCPFAERRQRREAREPRRPRY